MYECFLEIAFEAELNTEEHPELMELAPELCNEHPDTRAAAIQELREMVYERGECSPRRLDDAFLLRFLRARKFVVQRAHKQLVRYCAFLEKYPELYKDVNLWGLARIGSVCEGCLYDRPDVGRLFIVRFGVWEPQDVPGIDLVRAGLLLAELMTRMPKIQILGITVLLDLEGVTFKHIPHMTPTVSYQIACLLGLALPLVVRSIHVINDTWLMNTGFQVFKRFINKRTWRRFQFHGHDLKSLHQQVDPACLPARYGGSCRNHVSVGTGLNKIKKYRDEHFDREMEEFGWDVKK